jgi:hypothetical protein
VAVKLANGDGTFAAPVLWSLTVNWSGFTFSTADINGDGRADLVASYIPSCDRGSRCLHCGKCQENVASLANFRHSARANSVDPT